MNMAKIIISIADGVPLVWDAEDWRKLREEHRICGTLVGSLVPFTHSDTKRGLPQVLLPEEVTLLVEKNIARIVRYPSLSRAPGQGVKEEYEKYRHRLSESQVECLMEDRKSQITLMIDKIVAGKKQKLTGAKKRKAKKKKKTDMEIALEGVCNNVTSSDVQVDKEAVLQEELQKIKPPEPDSTSVQTFTTYPWLREEDACIPKWTFPSTPEENLRYSVFKDCWERGHFLTSAIKFGGDFLVYPGDPYMFHAQYLVICVDTDAALRPTDLTSWSRLGSAVRKTVLLASHDGSSVNYLSLRWKNLKKTKADRDSYSQCD